MALLQEQVDASCLHATTEESGCCSEEMAGSAVCCPARVTQQGFTQGRAGSLQLKCFHPRAADSSGPLQFSQESPFLCLHVLSWNPWQNSPGTEIKNARDNKNSGLSYLQDFLAESTCLLHRYSFYASKKKGILLLVYWHYCVYIPHTCSRSWWRRSHFPQ